MEVKKPGLIHDRPTVGQIYLDTLKKDERPLEAEELRQEMHKNYADHIAAAIAGGLKSFDGDFFIQVETKKERLMPNTIRNYFVTRQTCPTPWYDQTVYKYHRQHGTIEFIWVIPAKDICLDYREYALQVPIASN